MKKVFPLTAPGLQPARVVEGIKNDVRKYVKRERRKALPEGVDFWDFNCAVGISDEAPTPKHVEEVVPAIDEAVKKEAASIYIEILSKPGHRVAKEPKEKTEEVDG